VRQLSRHPLGCILLLSSKYQMKSNQKAKNKIVLGYPYSGAFYWLLSAEEWRKTNINSPYVGTHPYYEILYGKDHNKVINETASLAILYEEIYLSPADCYFPKSENFLKGGNYKNTEIGVFTDWSWRREIADLFKITDELLRDPFIASMLFEYQEISKKQILCDTLVQLHISEKFGATIIASEAYLQLANRISKYLINLPPLQNIEESKRVLSGINKAFQISSLKFELNSLSEFVNLRTSKPLKKYASSFRSYLRDLPNGKLDELFLMESMLDAINSEELANKISGGMGITATVTGPISLIPFAGTVAGVVGMATDAGGRVASKVAALKSWWLLAPEIAKILSKNRIEKMASELRKNAT